MRAFWLVAFFCAMLGMAAGPVRADALRIATDARYAPFAFTTADGRLSGFEVDLGNQLCAIMEAACQWMPMPFEQMIPALQAGRIDAIMASMSITEERRRLVDFSARYYSTPVRFIAERGRTI